MHRRSYGQLRRTPPAYRGPNVHHSPVGNYPVLHSQRETPDHYRVCRLQIEALLGKRRDTHLVGKRRPAKPTAQKNQRESCFLQSGGVRPRSRVFAERRARNRTDRYLPERGNHRRVEHGYPVEELGSATQGNRSDASRTARESDTSNSEDRILRAQGRRTQHDQQTQKCQTLHHRPKRKGGT